MGGEGREIGERTREDFPLPATPSWVVGARIFSDAPRQMALAGEGDGATALGLADPARPRARALRPGLPQPLHASGLMRCAGPDAAPWRRTEEAGPTIELGTPSDLEIRVEATQAPVQMHSLQVRASKWFVTKSLTAVLQPYIRGRTIQAHHVQLPAGRFRLEIEIADITGAKTTEAYRVEVRGAVGQDAPLRTPAMAKFRLMPITVAARPQVSRLAHIH